MELTAKNIQLSYPELTITVDSARGRTEKVVAELYALVLDGKMLTVNIEQYRAKRSLDANAYCWVLCQKMAEVIGNSKEEVYKRFIRDYGKCDVLAIRSEAVESFIDVWGGRGLGWFAEDMGKCSVGVDGEQIELVDYNNVMAHYGSSVYNTKEMSILINELVDTAKELDIETRPEHEIQDLLSNWR